MTHIAPDPNFAPDEAFAKALDAEDPLAAFRDRFEIPKRETGEPVIYFNGNSLGLLPRDVRSVMEEELNAWGTLAVDAHFNAPTPWYMYSEVLRDPAARLVGGHPHEVVMMNGLTVNLHLMMITFYRPTTRRFKILMEDCAFPSDTYAVQTQIRHHGFDPEKALVVARPREGEHTLRTEDIESLIEREGDELALVLFGGINYFTGQLFDMGRIVKAARRVGCTVGFDLAHAVGNVELHLHDWDVDFAVWCSYKYLNSGPGSVAGCFVHERHAHNVDLPRFGGWWGNDPQTRFRMHLESEFKPVPSANAWQVSNPPILSLAAIRASLAIFEQATMPALRAKSIKMIEYLQFLLAQPNSTTKDSDKAEPLEPAFEIITPPNPEDRGCQHSILVHDKAEQFFDRLQAAGVVADFRQPNVIRVAPVPLFNTFHEIWRFAQVLFEHTSKCN